MCASRRHRAPVTGIGRRGAGPLHGALASAGRSIGGTAFRAPRSRRPRTSRGGSVLLPFLTQLDRRRLDAEQQARLSSIQQHLTNRGEDTAARVAAQLVYDQTTWLALLAREDGAQRRRGAALVQALPGGGRLRPASRSSRAPRSTSAPPRATRTIDAAHRGHELHDRAGHYSWGRRHRIILLHPTADVIVGCGVRR